MLRRRIYVIPLEENSNYPQKKLFTKINTDFGKLHSRSQTKFDPGVSNVVCVYVNCVCESRFVLPLLNPFVQPMLLILMGGVFIACVTCCCCWPADDIAAAAAA